MAIDLDKLGINPAVIRFQYYICNKLIQILYFLWRVLSNLH